MQLNKGNLRQMAKEMLSGFAALDANGNVRADGFIPGLAVTTTSNGTTALTANSVQHQVFIGTNIHTITLPSNAAAGQKFTISSFGTNTLIVNASNGEGAPVTYVSSLTETTYTALQDNPTARAHWYCPANVGVQSQAATVNTLAQRNSAGNLAVNAVLNNGASTTSAATTTVLVVGSAKKQVITGATTHTFTLPTTGVAAYQDWEFANTSSGAVTINSSAGNLVKTLAAGASTTVTALAATPTTAAQWFAS